MKITVPGEKKENGPKWTFILLDIWPDWEQIFQIFVSKMLGSTLSAEKQEWWKVRKVVWEVHHQPPSDPKTQVWSLTIINVVLSVDCSSNVDDDDDNDDDDDDERMWWPRDISCVLAWTNIILPRSCVPTYHCTQALIARKKQGFPTKVLVAKTNL